METIVKNLKPTTGTYSSIDEAVEVKINHIQKILNKMQSKEKKEVFGKK